MTVCLLLYSTLHNLKPAWRTECRTLSRSFSLMRVWNGIQHPLQHGISRYIAVCSWSFCHTAPAYNINYSHSSMPIKTTGTLYMHTAITIPYWIHIVTLPVHVLRLWFFISCRFCKIIRYFNYLGILVAVPSTEYLILPCLHDCDRHGEDMVFWWSLVCQFRMWSLWCFLVGNLILGFHPVLREIEFWSYLSWNFWITFLLGFGFLADLPPLIRPSNAIKLWKIPYHSLMLTKREGLHFINEPYSWELGYSCVRNFRSF